MVQESTWFWGTGRNKSAVARIRLRKGTGAFDINGRALDKYFTIERYRAVIKSPLEVTHTDSKFDVFATVSGGGSSGQAHAMVLGIARALAKADEAFLEKLRENHLLTRDSRMKERKKYGRRGARRGFQFSKR